MGDYLKQLVARKECAIDLGTYALAEAKLRFSGSLTVSRKEDASIVTDADKEIEEYVVREILRAFPKDAIVAEEGGSREGSSGFCWYIDPIDGTSNFSAGLPIFAVSLGIAYRGKPSMGIVGLPAHGQLFRAVDAQGAYEVKLHGFTAVASRQTGFRGAEPRTESHSSTGLHPWLSGARVKSGKGSRIAVSKKKKLADGIVLLAFRGLAARGGNEVNHAAEVLARIRKVRIAGSVVWSLAMIASGHAEGGVLLRLHSWDVAAGIVLVREAGGVVTDLGGKEPDLHAESISLVVSNGLVHKELLSKVHEAFSH